jgi:hypothetical protein
MFWIAVAAVALLPAISAAAERADATPRRFNISPTDIRKADGVHVDYPIVYVRSPRWFERDGRKQPARFAEFGHPLAVTPGTDLMLLHPNGGEEVLDEGGPGAIQDPYVSFDGQWVYYSKFHQATDDANGGGADIYKIHVASRKIVQLTSQTFSPNTGAADWSKLKLPYGVYNLAPCPVPGGKIVFTSNRNAYVPPRGYPRVTLQLFVMDDDGSNVERIGTLNIACALHPVILKNGRVLFSSLESQALHQGIHWGIWSIHPDGTNWSPVVSALLKHGGAESGFHFQAQLADESIIVERYYNQNQHGFGTLYKLPRQPPAGTASFGPGDLEDKRNHVPVAKVAAGHEDVDRMPFMPFGAERITPWIFFHDNPAYASVEHDDTSPRIGKVTHPCGAPDNHLLVAWTLGPIGGPEGGVKGGMGPKPIDSGIYLIRGGATTLEPGEMFTIHNDPNYNEQWPRPLVPYKQIYGVDEPQRLVHTNDGRRSPHLPEGTPFGLVGTSSMYKRESAPLGRVPEAGVTAEIPWQPGDTLESVARFQSITRETNWFGQGADAGRYSNDDIHAIRILIQEPLTDVSGHRKPLFGSHANERLRILGEIPVRKFAGAGAAPAQPLDPDGNPDTSFLAKIPADQAFTFQTLDAAGMVLNMAQTWHQLRPGEVRYDCGGCHAHSQQPTPFEKTAAARDDYAIFDLSSRTPLVTTKDRDESGQKWDAAGESGLRYVTGPLNVEYWRDVRPLLDRSCVACHTQKSSEPAGGLVLDDDDRARLENRQLVEGDEAPTLQVPATYARLVSRRNRESLYMRRFQSRRSLLVWKIYGRRLDGWTNDTFPSPINNKDPFAGVKWRGQDVAEYQKLVDKVAKGETSNDWVPIWVNNNCDTDFTGSVMPPAEAVAGTYRAPDGQTIKVPPLSAEGRLTIVRWIDLGSPIDLDPQYDPASPTPRSFGWMCDDQRPTLAITYPAAGENAELSQILIGMADAYTGLDLASFSVTADFALDAVPAGENLAERFSRLSDNRWQFKLKTALHSLPRGLLTVTIRDLQGNTTRLERTFSVR